MEIDLALDGQKLKCRIGYGAAIAATDHLKTTKKQEYRDMRDLLAECGDSPEAKTEIIRLTAEYLKNQTPTGEEVGQWLQSMEGLRFCLQYGTKENKDSKHKLSAETTEKVLDQMSEDDFRKLTEAVADVCFGSENAKHMRDNARQLLDLEKQKEHRKIELAKLEVEAWGKARDAVFDKLSPQTETESENAETHVAN